MMNPEHVVNTTLNQEFENWLWGSQSTVATHILAQLREQGVVMPELPNPTGESAKGQPIWKIDGDFAVVVQSFQHKVGIRVGKASGYVEMTRDQALGVMSALAAALRTER